MSDVDEALSCGAIQEFGYMDGSGAGFGLGSFGYVLGTGNGNGVDIPYGLSLGAGHLNFWFARANLSACEKLIARVL